MNSQKSDFYQAHLDYNFKTVKKDNSFHHILT